MEEDGEKIRKVSGVPAHGDLFEGEIIISKKEGLVVNFKTRGAVAKWLLFLLGGAAAIFGAYYIFL